MATRIEHQDDLFAPGTNILTHIMNQTSDAICLVGLNGRVQYINPSFTKLFGWERNEISDKYVPFIPYEQLDFIQQIRDGIEEGKTYQSVMSKFMRKDGSYLDVEMSASPYFEDQHIIGVISIIRDITEQVHARKKISEMQARYNALIENNPDPICTFDTKARFTGLNTAFEKATGYKRAELIGKSYFNILMPDHKKRSQSRFSITGEGNSQQFEIAICSKSGEAVIFSTNSMPIVVDGETVGVFTISKDITKAQRTRERLEHLVNHDELTGITNRRGLFEKLEKIKTQSDQTKKPFAVLFADCDRFKQINDELGHDVGDAILIGFAERLVNAVRDTDIVARLAGDEFVIILPDINGPGNAENTAQRILDKLQKPWHIHHHEVYTTSSIGISVYEHDNAEIDEILKRADLAMYDAKQKGRNNYAIFESNRKIS